MSYLNVQEVESALLNLQANYANLSSLITLPIKTHEGRTCHVIRIGRKPSNDCDNILFIGGVHAREWGSCEICISFAADLLEAYVTNSGLQYGGKIFTQNQIKTIVESLNIIIFPDVNPDGRNFSQTQYPLWRKNRNPNIGVDINRNYDFLWDFPNLFSPSSLVHSYTSTTPSSDVYHGPFPFSEPETRNVQWLLNQFPRIRWFIDIHSYSELLLHAWGDDQNQSNNTSMNFKNNSFNSVRGIRNDQTYREYITSCDSVKIISQANQMKNSINSVRGKNYTVQQAFDLYPTSGTSQDYVYSRYYTNPTKGKIFAFTIEWGTQFQPPWSEMENIIRDVSSALVTFCVEAEDLRFIDQRWTFGTSIEVENPTVGILKHLTLYSSIQLPASQPVMSNWILASVPTPNVTEGWRISAVMLRCRIAQGLIDKIGIRDGNDAIHGFEELTIGNTTNWETIRLELPCPRNFRFGLGVSIHVNGPFDTGGPSSPPGKFDFASIGIEFTRDDNTNSGPVVTPNL